MIYGSNAYGGALSGAGANVLNSTGYAAPDAELPWITRRQMLNFHGLPGARLLNFHTGLSGGMMLNYHAGLSVLNFHGGYPIML